MAYNEGAKQPKEQEGLGGLVAEVLMLSAEARGRLQTALLRAGQEPQREPGPMKDNRLDELAEQLHDVREHLRSVLTLIDLELAAKL